jgi:hypothetical protein
MKSKYVLAGILLFCLCYRLYYFFVVNPNLLLYNSDSVDYFAPVNLFKGIVDLYRPPVYPYVLELFGYLSQTNFVRNLLAFQQIISFLSIIPFYVACRRLVPDIYLTIITTVVYGCWGDAIIQNANINPECLCIAGSAFFLFLLSAYLNKPTSFWAFAMGLFPLVLILLKPTYLVLAGIVLLFFIIRFICKRAERSILYAGLAGILITIIGVIGYCEMNKKHNGEFTLSKIALDNSIANVVISGAYKAGGDAELIARIDSTLPGDFYKAVYLLNNDHMDNYARLMNRFPAKLAPSDDMLFSARFPNTVNYPIDRIDRFVGKAKESRLYRDYILYEGKEMISQYPIFFVILLLEGILLVFVFLKYRRIAWMHAICLLFVGGQAFTIIVGGAGQWERVFLPAFPFALLLAASFVRILISVFKWNEVVLALE